MFFFFVGGGIGYGYNGFNLGGGSDELFKAAPILLEVHMPCG